MEISTFNTVFFQSKLGRWAEHQSNRAIQPIKKNSRANIDPAAKQQFN